MGLKRVEANTEFEPNAELTLVVDVNPVVNEEYSSVATREPQVFWLDVNRVNEAASAGYFVRGNETRSFRGVEVVEATSVVKAATAMQSALEAVSTVMDAHELPTEVINTVLDALDLAKMSNVLKYRARAAK